MLSDLAVFAARNACRCAASSITSAVPKLRTYRASPVGPSTTRTVVASATGFGSGKTLAGRSTDELKEIPPWRQRVGPSASWLQHIDGLRRAACPLAGPLGNPYSRPMSPLQARVENGRLVLDEPTALPEGTVVDLVADDEGDDLTDEERRALHEALSASWKSAESGRLRPASAILDDLRRSR